MRLSHLLILCPVQEIGLRLCVVPRTAARTRRYLTVGLGIVFALGWIVTVIVSFRLI